MAFSHTTVPPMVQSMLYLFKYANASNWLGLLEWYKPCTRCSVIYNSHNTHYILSYTLSSHIVINTWLKKSIIGIKCLTTTPWYYPGPLILQACSTWGRILLVHLAADRTACWQVVTIMWPRSTPDILKYTESPCVRVYLCVSMWYVSVPCNRLTTFKSLV